MTARPAAHGPEVPGLLDAFWSYEDALMTDDLAALDALFAPGPETLRGDATGLLVGHEQISAFRGSRGGAPKRRIVDLEVRALGADHAAVVAITELLTGGRGQQTQVWSRGADGWKVAVAQVAVSPPAFDRRIWRVLGAPLIPAAEGPLSGHGVAVKDVFAVAGHRIGGGSPALLAGARPAPRHAEAVAALLHAGASVTGIAATDELAYSLAGTSTHYGTPPNPAAAFRISGGSSSGSASAVSLGHATIGLGTDTGGSIRVPAAYQGLWGLRSTHGAISREGVLPLAPSFDTVGILTRTPELLARAADALLPAVARTPLGDDLTLRTMPGLLDLVDAEVADTIEAALRRWSASLPLHETIPLDAAVHRSWLRAFRTIQGREAWCAHGDWVARHEGRMAPDVAARFRTASSLTAPEENRAREIRAQASASLRERVAGGVLAVPSASSVAPLLRDAAAGGPVIERQRERTMALTCLAGLAGLPAVSVPLRTAGGLPVGLTLVGPAGSDLDLIRLAHDLEAAS